MTIADLEDIKEQLGPIVADAVREHGADAVALLREATRARLADREWMDTDALCAYLGIAKRTARQYRAEGAFGTVSVRFSRAYVRRAAVDAYLEAGEREA